MRDRRHTRKKDNIFGKNLERCRIMNMYNTDELARAIRASSELIKDLEAGRKKPRPETIEKICRVLNVTTEELTGVKDAEI